MQDPREARTEQHVYLPETVLTSWGSDRLLLERSGGGGERARGAYGRDQINVRFVRVGLMV